MLNRDLIINNLNLLVSNLNTLKHDLEIRTTQNEALKTAMSKLELKNSHLKSQNRTLVIDLKSLTKETRLQKIQLNSGVSRTPVSGYVGIIDAPEVTEVLSMLKSTRDNMKEVMFCPESHPETDRLGLVGLRAAGLEGASMSPSPTKGGDMALTVQTLADTFDLEQDPFGEALQSLSPTRAHVLKDNLIKEIEQRALGLGSMEFKEDDVIEEGLLKGIKSCEKRVDELRVNRVVENLFHDSPPRAYKGNPFDGLDGEEGGGGDMHVDSSFLVQNE
ncbi:hypothetical protein TL16_g12231 [Triparma laevis f. inornata]|uniref:Uncharacterized protein n=1 Tax=Triparma laevis f. inornata TaxID=1714386 RepID=A0A9W7BQ60_9STRA|nr:hypothetical protein TL16_g12231 [Triparma laevis f. inornata]